MTALVCHALYTPVASDASGRTELPTVRIACHRTVPLPATPPATLAAASYAITPVRAVDPVNRHDSATTPFRAATPSVVLVSVPPSATTGHPIQLRLPLAASDTACTA